MYDSLDSLAGSLGYDIRRVGLVWIRLSFNQDIEFRDVEILLWNQDMVIIFKYAQYLSNGTP